MLRSVAALWPLTLLFIRNVASLQPSPSSHRLSVRNFASTMPETSSEARKIRAVLFDLDGTLLDTETLSDLAIFEAFGDSLPKNVREEFRRGGDRLPWDCKEPTLGLRGGDWIPMVINYSHKHWGVAREGETSELPPAPSVKDFWNQWEQNLMDLCPQVEECPGATALVQTFARETDLSLAIATSSRRVAVDAKRQAHEEMFRHMREIVTGDDPAIQHGKPAPDIYIETARRLGVDPSECIVFEDALAGVQSGKAAGCVVVAVPDPRQDKKIFENEADLVLDSMWDFDGTPWGIQIDMKAKALPN